MKLVKLNKICDLKNGFAFKSKDYVDVSNTLSCRMSSIRPGGSFDLEHNQRFLPDSYAELYSDYLLYDGDIIIAMTDLAGDPKILGVPTIVKTDGKNLLQNQRVGKLVVKDDSKIYIPFLQYALNRPQNKNYYRKFAGGGLQINVGKKEILNNSIPLPPLDEQKKIASILDAADAYRQKTKGIMPKYEELIQSLFLDMFGDPVNNPKGWKFSNVEKILSTKSQNGHYATKEEYIDTGVQMVHMSDAFKQKVIPGNLKRVKFDNKLLSKYELKPSDLLISRRSLNYEGSAKPCLIPEYGEPLIYESSLIKISPNQDIVNTMFLFYFFSNSRARSKYIFKHVTKSTISGINNKGLNSIEIYLPPIELQNQFEALVNAIELQKTITLKSSEKSEALFNSLLQRAFKGKLA